MLILLLLMLNTPAGQRWVKVKDSYRIHWLYVTRYGNEIGGYYQPYKESFQASGAAVPYTAQCWEGKPVEFPNEQGARDFVLHCPD